LVASLARPEGNVTGLSALGPELNTKRLEVIKDAIPKLARVGFLRDMQAGSTLAVELKELAAKNRLPAIYHQGRFAEDGGLMYYGVNLLDLNRRAATYVDKILKGAKPADLPVEQPMKFEFVINLKATKQIGLTIPPNVLARADKVIK